MPHPFLQSCCPDHFLLIGAPREAAGGAVCDPAPRARGGEPKGRRRRRGGRSARGARARGGRGPPRPPAPHPPRRAPPPPPARRGEPRRRPATRRGTLQTRTLLI